MARQTNVTYEKVMQAVEQLRTGDKSVTVENVRCVIGGSTVRIAEHLKRYRHKSEDDGVQPIISNTLLASQNQTLNDQMLVNQKLIESLNANHDRLEKCFETIGELRAELANVKAQERTAKQRVNELEDLLLEHQKTHETAMSNQKDFLEHYYDGKISEKIQAIDSLQGKMQVKTREFDRKTNKFLKNLSNKVDQLEENNQTQFQQLKGILAQFVPSKLR